MSNLTLLTQLKTTENNKNQLKNGKNCEFCENGTMFIVRKGNYCLRWVCIDCYRSRKIDLKRLNHEIGHISLTKRLK